MVAFILPANSASSGGYEISNSCQFNIDAHCEFTPSSGSGSTQFTMSAWIKNAGPGGVSEDGYIISGKDADNGLKFLSGSNNGKMQFIEYDGGDNAYYIRTNRLFRDPSAWFHVVLIYDAPDGTAGDRMRLYINGTEANSFSHEVTLPQNRANAGFTRNNVPIRVGANASGSNARFNGYLADVYFCDGQNYEPTEFGETNDNGVWIPKEADVSFGTNGFKLEFKQTGTSANSSGIGADTSGNDNHFSVSGLAATNITTDTPTNNFCTWNPLVGRAASYSTFKEGNLDAKFPSGSIYQRATGSIGVTSGKWYAEMKCISDGGNDDLKVGVEPINPDQTDVTNLHRVIQSWNGYKSADVGGGSFGDSYTDGDIVGIYLDMDNGTIKFSKNGTMMASSASAYTDLVSAMPDGGWAFFSFGYDNANIQANFGNPPFSISSSNADANGYGSFEYSPTLSSTNYYALCTKNLAEFG